jgi:hypothetical protein
LPQAKASTVARGYGQEHRRRREALRRLVEMGAAVCSRCGLGITPGTPWDLDHTPDRTGYLGPAHRRCNRAAGARVANSRRARRRPRVPGGVFGPLSS